MLSMQYLQDTCNKNVSNEIEKSQQHLKHGTRVSLELVFDSQWVAKANSKFNSKNNSKLRRKL